MIAFLLGNGALSAADDGEPAKRYEKEILPIFENYCYDCHGDGLKKGKLALDDYGSVSQMVADRDRWQKIRDHIDFRLMPPPDEFAPGEDERAKLVKWIDEAVFPVDYENPDPGEIPLRRLSRTEYKCTIRDLLGVEIDIAEILPPDDSGYGFDNIGDILTISPVHMERYLDAAGLALEEALASVRDPEGSKALDGNRDRNILAAKIVIEGPPSAASPSQRGLIPEREKNESDEAHFDRVMGQFLPRAFRRPVTGDEIGRYRYFLTAARKLGENYDSAILQALTAALVSPSFLFREEPVIPGAAGTEKSLISEHALASRLSYFLWSSMPDERLQQLADANRLRENLPTEIKRMIESPKAEAIIDNFVGQWLQLRDMSRIVPRRGNYMGIDRRLPGDMKTETEMLVKYIIREDLPIHTLLDADFTFLNERLARHYGIEGVKGEDFRKVSIAHTERRGLLGQGSFLTLTSHQSRTSPVLRGKYVLENILNTPPPPAPPNIPSLEDAKGRGRSLTMRQELERHREDPACASCHALMDPIGFGLENYDIVGRWRDNDNGKPINAADTLVTGQKFASAEEMRDIFINDYKEEFHRAFAVKLLTYALGRGVEYYDRPAIDGIVLKGEADDGRFLSWVNAVIESVPFQFRRN